ncbi:MAG: endonuclease/exonuclease/phosphatase family protein [Bacteriovoracaceae bacterium]
MKYLTLLLFVAFSASAALKIGTFNIRNFDKPGTNTNKKLLKEIILNINPDLLAVQEIFNESSFRSFIQKEFSGYKIILSKCGGGGSQKLGFIYKTSSLKALSSYEDKRLSSALNERCGSLRPAMVGLFKDLEKNEVIAALSVHLKAGSGSRNFSRRAKQYDALKVIFDELKQKGYKNILAAGDFNTTGWDLRNADFHNFEKFLNGVSASTTASKVACSSYWSGRDYQDGIEEASTLDHVVYTDNFYNGPSQAPQVGGHCALANCQDVPESELGEGYQSVSDHCPVSLAF